MKKTVDDINFELAEKMERKLRHDVMSHIHAWGEQCPKARPIMHLGATSCYVCDNTELLQVQCNGIWHPTTCVCACVCVCVCSCSMQLCTLTLSAVMCACK